MTKEEFIKKVRDAIITGETEQALDLLVSQREGFAKDSFTDIAMLSGRFKEARIALGNGTINFNDFSGISALVRQSVIDIIVRIENPGKGYLSKKKGQLLYKIPSTMQVAKKHNCIVRVAYDRDLLTKKLTVDENTIIEDITLTKVMSAELIDNNPEKAFDVKTAYDNRQYLIKDGYTEWLFGVTPLKTGKHTLTLKVSAIEKIDGESQKRNIVFEKGISIESEIEESKDEGFVVVARPKEIYSIDDFNPDSVIIAHQKDVSYADEIDQDEDGSAEPGIGDLDWPVPVPEKMRDYISSDGEDEGIDQEEDFFDDSLDLDLDFDFTDLETATKEFKFSVLLEKGNDYEDYKKIQGRKPVDLELDLDFTDLEKILGEREIIDDEEKELIYFVIQHDIDNNLNESRIKKIFYPRAQVSKITQYPWTKISRWVGKTKANKLYTALVIKFDELQNT